jgi:PAS domain S-box-containing protein
MRAYARQIGANEEAVIAAFHEVPAMSREKFGEVAQALFTLANQLSDAAYRNVQQARFISEKQQAEAKLAESEIRYRSIFELANDGIFLQDETGFIDCNQRGADMYGLPRERIIGHHPGEFAPERQPDGRLSVEVAAEKIAAVMAGIPQTFEWRPLRADGSPFDVEITLSRIDFGQKACIQAIVRDITERKRAEETLQWQTHFQRLLMDISLTCINLPPADVSAAISNSLAELGAFVGADRAYVFIYDFPAQICINTHEWCAEGITPQIDQLQAVPLEAVPEWVTAHTQGQPIYIPDVIALPPGGMKDILTAQEIISLLTAPMMDGTTCTGFIGFDSVNQPRHYSEDEQRLLSVFAGLLVNIHRRQRAEEALHESESKFRSIIQSSPVGYHIYNLAENGKLIFNMFNPAADAILRASHEQFMEREILEAFPGLAGTGIPEMYTAVAKGELETQNFEAPYDQAGIRGVYEVRVFQGAPGQAVVNFVDISERKQAEEAILQAQKNLASKNKELEQLVYVASHDLRSPLVNVDGFSRELEYDLKTISGAMEGNDGSPAALEQTLRAELPDMRKSLERIRNSARQMDALLKGLLKLSRSGRAALHIAPVDMNDLLRQVCASFAFRVQELGAELTVADLPPCLGDAMQITQVFANLVDNAIKYRDTQRQCQVSIAGQVEGNRAVYRVEDNGIGIAGNHQENIFELFHRLNPADTEGEGLGLTIARQVLGRLDGEIKVESQPGVGSSFIVSLPCISGRKNG